MPAPSPVPRRVAAPRPGRAALLLALVLVGLGQAPAQAQMRPPGLAMSPEAAPPPGRWTASDATRLLLVEAEAALRLESDATLGILPGIAALTQGSRAALSQRRAEADAALAALLGAAQAEAAAAPGGVPEGLSAGLQGLRSAQQVVAALQGRIDAAARGGTPPSLVEWSEAVARRGEALRRLGQLLAGHRPPPPAPPPAPPPPAREAGRQAERSLATAGRPAGDAAAGPSGKGEPGAKPPPPEKGEAGSDGAMPIGLWIAKGLAILAAVLLLAWRNRLRERTDQGRKNRRVAVDMAVTLEGDAIGPGRPARITNISMGGAALAVADLHLRRGSRLTIAGSRLGSLPAQTVHCGGGVLRVHFLALDQAQALELGRLTAPPPAEADRPRRGTA
ncbi:PilZ domain-containing protein [Pseudoroseomonas cervicalis]|uniref:PilZ domain-containing protein n=1 Tax=Teichococcus cervicalis TaxID=204525 RepID=UPI0027819978|nr:PilZ domain-containing protein [Pseudoroseomonas cervicalis]MDQ1080898.1 hypothetical protein [Pseudoroseomonas cervicalis]